MSSNKRKHTFDAYHRERVAKREDLVRRALELVAPEQYDTLTALAKTVAKIVTELEKKQTKDGENPQGVSYTTLVRTGSKYKHILQAHLDSRSGSKQTDKEEELEELRIHCAHIEHENQLLKQRLSSVSAENSAQAASEGDYGRFSAKDVQTLIDLVDGVMSQVRDAFLICNPDDTDEEYPTAGIYGPTGLIAEYETLVRLTELRDAIK